MTTLFWFKFLLVTQMVKNQLQCRIPEFDPWVGKIPWRRECLPTPVFLPGEFHRQRSLVGYSLWGHKESDLTERLTLSLWSKIPYTVLPLDQWFANSKTYAQVMMPLTFIYFSVEIRGLNKMINMGPFSSKILESRAASFISVSFLHFPRSLEDCIRV